MNYEETCEYLYHQMPMFERQGASGYKEGLSNTHALDEHFGHPHQQFATIHVGGTNGKGSVSHTLAAILQQCGYTVGLYTSPHLVDFRERIRINGEMISEEYVVDFVEKEHSFFEPLSPSFFEVTTAMAFKYFADKKIDIAVVEVGLGGRLDCTNIITPLVSVITNISYDHTQFLGDTLAKIASEKAGIIKRGVPVVIGETHEETRPVFEAKAIEEGCKIVFADDKPEIKNATPIANGMMHYVTKHWGELDGDLGGIYQEKNLNTVFAAINVLMKKGCLSKETLTKELADALSHVCSLTGLTGRWQVVSTSPYVVCDTGHNVGGWNYISQQLRQVSCQQMHIVFGMVDDKDINHVLDMLPKDAIFYFTQANTKRAINGTVVKTLAAEHGLDGACYPSVYEAYKAALQAANPEDFIFVGGSSYLVGDFLKNCI
ncbi:MAG: bifunctional folylpolyglutamate synthase/dihydrofolate synthase [Prevotella sp.]|jgi:dihydrofolate synthase/folylpolyglutamate synthase|nr:bifunctional folylpolyglutamate synthase/dihydrofolate synthase [Prevotella sp.]